MKLTKVRITNFRSIEDSEEFLIGDLTCLVGKNEAGKTAILHAIYGLNPFGKYEYDKTRDYPRRYLSKYDERHDDGKSKVISSTWELSQNDLEAVIKVFGKKSIKSNEIEISASIGDDGTSWIINYDEKECLLHLMDKHALTPVEKELFKGAASAEEISTITAAQTQKSVGVSALEVEINAYRNKRVVLKIIDIISNKRPKIFYTSHFERMSGEISLNQLQQDKANGSIKIEDKIFLDFLEYAGTSIDELQSAEHYEELKAKCEGASNDITDEIFQFWSQNEALRVEIDLGQGRPQDKPPFNSGTIAKIRIENTNHRVTVPLSERSAGFVWFFSFLAQFKQLKKTTGNAIILLDEPGLTLHGKAQADLLKYIEERLLPEHQVIFTTHSPFMVPTNRLENVRIVEDLIKHDGRKTEVFGTKVSSDVLTVDSDTLFPLQGALGYEITQSLFIGENTLLVEGPSDVLYLQAFSSVLKELGREGLSSKWTICPSGGIDKIAPFASLFGANKINIAVLCDLAHGDKAKVDRLKKSSILNAAQLFTASDFTGKDESDIEDLLHADIYIEILNSTYNLSGKNTVTEKKLNEALTTTVRIVKKAEAYFNLLPESVQALDHFQPSRWLIENIAYLKQDKESIKSSLNMFESIFNKFNKFVK